MHLKHLDIKQFKGLGSVQAPDLGAVNAFVGKNNSGKSTILHAIDMAGLALSTGNWGVFQPKREIKDLFRDVGDFSISVVYSDDTELTVGTTEKYGPRFSPQNPNENQKFQSILVWPDISLGLKPRQHRTPKQVMQYIKDRRFTEVDGLDILFAIQYYASREERGLTPSDYDNIIEEVKSYFPDIEQVTSNRTDQDIATLTYKEFGEELDILYSGSGLKHFVDVLIKTTISGADIVLLDEPEASLHPDLQRQFIEYLNRMTREKGVQLFMATHSPVLLNYADTVTYYRVTNTQGTRSIVPVKSDAIHTLLSDMGLRPSDVLNQDMCLLVEGPSDVVFWEHVLETLYREEFRDAAVGIVQYGGGSAQGITNGTISISNLVSAQNYTFWIRDRDTPVGENPETQATQFKHQLERHGLPCHILERRELEFYYPETLLVAAQQGDEEKEEAVKRIRHGDQRKSFEKAARDRGVCVPTGKYLRRLLQEHLTSTEQLDHELRELVEEQLMPLKREVLGLHSDQEGSPNSGE